MYDDGWSIILFSPGPSPWAFYTFAKPFSRGEGGIKLDDTVIFTGLSSDTNIEILFSN